MSSVTDLATATADGDPRTALHAVAALRKVLEHVESVQVGRARAVGLSWQEIADVLDVSKQAVHKKHARTWRS